MKREKMEQALPVEREQVLQAEQGQAHDRRKTV